MIQLRRVGLCSVLFILLALVPTTKVFAQSNDDLKLVTNFNWTNGGQNPVAATGVKCPGSGASSYQPGVPKIKLAQFNNGDFSCVKINCANGKTVVFKPPSITSPQIPNPASNNEAYNNACIDAGNGNATLGYGINGTARIVGDVEGGIPGKDTGILQEGHIFTQNTGTGKNYRQFILKSARIQRSEANGSAANQYCLMDLMITVYFNQPDRGKITATPTKDAPTSGNGGKCPDYMLDVYNGKVVPIGSVDKAPPAKSTSSTAAENSSTGSYGEITAGTEEPATDSEDTSLLKDCSDGDFGWNPINWIPNALDWFGCAMIKATLGILDGASSWLATNLETTATTSTGESPAGQSEADTALKSVWSQVLRIANILFVIAFLIMIISTALNVGILDAYTIKKYLPKIIIAVVLANLSWFIVSQAIEITNVLGESVKSIILSPLKEPLKGDASINGAFNGATGGALIGILTTGGIAAIGPVLAGGWMVLLPTVLTLLFAALTAIVVIMIRKVLIFGLIVFAPIAITMWAIPGMDSWAKRWWKLLIEMLMVYPFIMAMFALGEFAAILTLMTNPTDSGNIVPGLMAIAFLCIPLFMLPTVFKLASSTLGNITGMVNDKGKGLIDRSKKARGKAIGEGWENIKSGRRFKTPNGANSFRAKLNRGLQTGAIVGTGKAGFRKSKLQTELAATRTSWDFNAAKEMLEKDEEMQLIKKDDDKLHALTHGQDEDHIRQILQASASGRFANPEDAPALEQAVAEIMRVRKRNGTKATRIAGVISQAATGTAYKTAGQMLEDINFAAGEDRTTAGLMLAEMRGAAMQSGRVDLGGAGFAHSLKTMDDLRQGRATTGEATESMLNNVYQSQGGATLVHSSMKKVAVEQMAPIVAQSVQSIATTGTEQEIMRNVASVANAYDGLAASSPEKARVFADSVMGADISIANLSAETLSSLHARGWRGSQTVSMQELIAASRGNEDFQSMRREYQSEVAGTAGQPAPPGTTPTQPPPAPGK